MAIAIVTDLPKWRSAIRAGSADELTKEDARLTASKLGFEFFIAYHCGRIVRVLFDLLVKALLWLSYFAFPVASIFLGYLSLLGLAQVSNPISGDLCFWFSIMSFWISAFSAILIAWRSSSYDRAKTLRDTPIV